MTSPTAPGAIPARRLAAAVLVLAGLAASSWLYRGLAGIDDTPAAAGSLYALAAAPLGGGAPAGLTRYDGQVSLVVNVASACGLAPQLAGLERLYQRYRDRGFVILAFPSDDFWQEPLDAVGIRAACATRGLTFPVFDKVSVRGDQQAPVYAFLTSTGNVPLWNFAKYLVGRDGRVRAFFGSLVEPDDPALTSAIEAALAAPPGAPAHGQ